MTYSPSGLTPDGRKLSGGIGEATGPTVPRVSNSRAASCGVELTKRSEMSLVLPSAVAGTGSSARVTFNALTIESPVTLLKCFEGVSAASHPVVGSMVTAGPRVMPLSNTLDPSCHVKS